MSPVKEPYFFIYYGDELDESRYNRLHVPRFKKLRAHSITNLDDYLTLFDGVKNEKAIGEASAIYLFTPRAAASIHRSIPHAKLIAILRNPNDRTYSHFLMESDGQDASTENFLEALKLDTIHAANRPWELPWYIRYGFYDIQLQYYLKFFAATQLRVFLYEDLQRPIPMLQDIFRFLEVDDTFLPEVSRRYNVRKALRLNPIWRAAIKVTPVALRTKLNHVLPAPVFRWYMSRRHGATQKIEATQCPPEAREMLRPIFRDHILRLQDMIQRDLTHWLT